MGEPTREEIAWAAGLFEGEGCIHELKKTSASLSVAMTDLDVLERFREVVGAGHIGDARQRQANWKPIYQLQIYGREDVARILALFLPWFQSRRRAKAMAVLKRLECNPGRHADKTHCSRGHLLSDNNVYRWKRDPRRRICRTCHRENAQRQYHDANGRQKQRERRERRRLEAA